MKRFYLREIFLCRGVRDGKLKETLDSASRLAMGGKTKNKKKTETNMTLMDTVARERVSEINWVTQSYRNIILAQIKAQLGTVGEKSIESRIARKQNQLKLVTHSFRFFKSE